LTNRPPNYRAIATKASIQSLFAIAEAEGEVSIWVDTEHACTVIRRKCYAYRAQLRKGNVSLTGMETSAFDSYTFPYAQDNISGRWKFTITANEEIEFELILPEDPVKPIPHFDWIDPEHDVWTSPPNLENLENEFEKSADEFTDDENIPF